VWAPFDLFTGAWSLTLFNRLDGDTWIQGQCLLSELMSWSWNIVKRTTLMFVERCSTATFSTSVTDVNCKGETLFVMMTNGTSLWFCLTTSKRCFSFPVLYYAWWLAFAAETYEVGRYGTTVVRTDVHVRCPWLISDQTHIARHLWHQTTDHRPRTNSCQRIPLLCCMNIYYRVGSKITRMVFIFSVTLSVLQCSDAVGWATGRVFDL